MVGGRWWQLGFGMFGAPYDHAKSYVWIAVFFLIWYKVCWYCEFIWFPNFLPYLWDMIPSSAISWGSTMPCEDMMRWWRRGWKKSSWNCTNWIKKQPSCLQKWLPTVTGHHYTGDWKFFWGPAWELLHLDIPWDCCSPGVGQSPELLFPQSKFDIL